jgi:hypothetical protein
MRQFGWGMLATGLLATLSCAPELAFNGGDSTSSVADVTDRDGSSFDPPAVDSGPVRVRITNRSTADADVRVTIFIGAQIVYFSARRISAGGDTVALGPDLGDRVRIEATLIHDSPIVLPMRVFSLGTDFQPGGTISIVLRDPRVEDAPDDDGPPNPAPLEARILGLDESVATRPGGTVSFGVATSGAQGLSTLRVFADPGSTPLDGDEIELMNVSPAPASAPVDWHTVGAALGEYRVYAEVRDAGRSAVSNAAAGIVRVNAPPMAMFNAPRPKALVTRGRSLPIRASVDDPDDDARFTLFLDTDGRFDGDELAGGAVIIAAGVSEDAAGQEFSLRTSRLAPGPYFVGLAVADAVGVEVVYVRIVVDLRLVGRIDLDRPSPADLTVLQGAATTTPYVTDSFALGAAIDITRDYNGDGRNDLAVADPRATIIAIDLPGAEPEPRGVVYLHDGGQGQYAHWPPLIATPALRVALYGAINGEQIGTTLSLVRSFDGDDIPDLVAADPLAHGLDGQNYLIAGRKLIDPSAPVLILEDTLQVDELLGDTGSFERAGNGIAALRNFAANAFAETVFGAPGYLLNTGRVAILRGGAAPPFNGELNEIDDGPVLHGWILQGEAPGDRAGHAVADARKFHCAGEPCDDHADLLVGAPGADGGAGRVYLVFGSAAFAGGSLGDPAVARHVLVGENPGDLAGAALTAGDFDGDQAPDLVVAAPQFADGRGRVYIIRNFSGQGRPRELSLADVGSSLAGMKLDGAGAGDGFGQLVTFAGDIDGDGREDLLIGAPNAGQQRGAAYLIYGRPLPAPTAGISDVATIDLPGFFVLGELPDQRLGAALSAGDIDGDRSPDVAIGAPGNAPEGPVHGEAYLLRNLGPPTPAADPAAESAP